MFDLFYKLSAMEFGKVVFLRKHCPLMKAIKKFLFVMKIIYEPIILFTIGELEYRFYDGENTLQLKLYSYVQTGFVLWVGFLI